MLFSALQLLKNIFSRDIILSMEGDVVSDLKKLISENFRIQQNGRIILKMPRLFFYRYKKLKKSPESGDFSY